MRARRFVFDELEEAASHGATTIVVAHKPHPQERSFALLEDASVLASRTSSTGEFCDAACACKVAESGFRVLDDALLVQGNGSCPENNIVCMHIVRHGYKKGIC